MTTVFRAGDMTIHRVVDYEGGFMDPFEMFPALTPEQLANERDWLTSIGGLGPDGRLELCFQSYVVRTPHHVILLDSCIGNDKHRPTRPEWHMKSDDRFMRGSVGILTSHPARVRARPLHTVSQSEDGFEKVMQCVSSWRSMLTRTSGAMMRRVVL